MRSTRDTQESHATGSRSGRRHWFNAELEVLGASMFVLPIRPVHICVMRMAGSRLSASLSVATSHALCAARRNPPRAGLD